jgi:putative tricarboxylic transport membrane protein
MDVDIFLQAVAQTFVPPVMLTLIIGAFLGVVIGSIPGLGSVVALTICLPFTFAMDPLSAMALLLAMYACTIYGGTITCILINTPGTPASAATALDGFPMAKQGKAELAMGWATVATIVGGLTSCFVLLFAAPQLAAVALRFGPVETAALIFMGLSCIATVSGKNKVKGLLSGVIGLSLCLVGLDPISGTTRFTFGSFSLTAGLDLVAVIVGIFALAEMLDRVSIAGKNKDIKPVKCSGLRLPPLSEWKAPGRITQLIKSSFIGVGIGILPGAGSTTAAFIAYGEAKRSSPRRDNFGLGEPDGIIAPESANNAVTGGGLVPTFALGIPGDAIAAVMLATMVLHGLVPGVRLMQDSPVIFYSSFMTLSMATILCLPFGWLVTKGFGTLLRTPEALLICIVVILCILGTYGVRNSVLDLNTMLVLGVLGVLFRYFEIPAPPLVIGIVLGNIFERALLQSVILTRGELSAILNYPIAMCLLFVAFLMWFGGPIGKLVKSFRKPVPQE